SRRMARWRPATKRAVALYSTCLTSPSGRITRSSPACSPERRKTRHTASRSTPGSRKSSKRRPSRSGADTPSRRQAAGLASTNVRASSTTITPSRAAARSASDCCWFPTQPRATARRQAPSRVPEVLPPYGERPTEDAAGMRAGGFPTAQHDPAVHDRGVEAGGLLPQSSGAGGQVVHHLGHVGRDAIGIEDDHVGGEPLAEQAALVETPGRRGFEGEHAHALLEAERLTAPHPVGEHLRLQRRVHDLRDVR